MEIVTIPPSQWSQYAIFPNTTLESSNPTQIHILSRVQSLTQATPDKKFYSRPSLVLVGPDAVYIGLSFVDIGEDWNDDCAKGFDHFLTGLCEANLLGSPKNNRAFKFLKISGNTVESNWIHCDKIDMAKEDLNTSRLFKYEEDDPFRDSTNFNHHSLFTLPDLARQESENEDSRNSRISIKTIPLATAFAAASSEQQRQYSVQIQLDTNLPPLFNTQSLSALEKRLEQFSLATPNDDGTTDVAVKTKTFDLTTLTETEDDFHTTINTPLDTTITNNSLSILDDDAVFGDLLLEVSDNAGILTEIGGQPQVGLKIIPVPLCPSSQYGTKTVTQRQLYIANALNNILAKVGHPDCVIKGGLNISYTVPYSLVYKHYHEHSSEFEATLITTNTIKADNDDDDEWRGIVDSPVSNFSPRAEGNNNNNRMSGVAEEESDDDKVFEAVAQVPTDDGDKSSEQALSAEQIAKLQSYDQVLIVPDEYKYMLDQEKE